jgi:long-chain fatty acid transport protein
MQHRYFHVSLYDRLRPAARALFLVGDRPSGRRWVIRLSAVLLAFLAVTADLEATDGLEPIGVSMQSRMRGGADVAVGDSALSQIDNPATLSLSPRDVYSVDFASQFAIVDARWRGPIDASSSQKKLVHLHNAGIAIPINDRLTAGIAFHSKAGLGTSYKMRHLMIPYMRRRVTSDFKDMAVQLNLAYQVTDKLSVGVGGRAEVVTSRFGLVLGPADVEVGRGYAYGGGFQLGMHYQAREDLAFGLGYRSPTWFGDLSGGNAKASLLGVVPVPLGSASIDQLRLPQKVTGGVAWDATDWLKLIGETRWLNYRNSSFNSMTLATDGPLFNLRYPFPLGYKDQWIFIFGQEYKLDENWTFATGYHYATNPIRRANKIALCSVPTRHHFTTGLRYETDRWWVGGGYILAFRESVKGPGYSRIPLGVDYGLSSMSQAHHSISMGFGFRF